MKPFLFSLRFRLILLVLLAVLPALGLALYTGLEGRRQAAVEAQDNAVRLARLMARDQDRLVEGADQLLNALARLPAIRDRDPAACNALFADLLTQHGRYANFVASDPDGDVFCSGEPLSGPVNFADRAWFQQALATGDFVVGEYVIGRITGKALLVFAYPTLDGAGQVRAVVSAGLDLAWLDQLAAETQLPPGSTFTVVDRGGTVLARDPDPQQWVGQTLPAETLIQAMLARQGEGTVVTDGLDGVPRLYGFAPAQGGLYVSIGIPTRVAYAEANRTLAQHLLGLGLVAALALAAAWVGSEAFLLRRVRDLVGATQRLSAGDLGARTGLPYGVGELSQLARAFDGMAEALQQRESERARMEASLRASTERYSLLFDTMLDGLALHEIVCDESGQPCDYRFLEVNPAFEALTGLRAADVVGRTVLEALPGTEAHWIDTYGRVALTGESARFESYSAALGKHFEIVAYSPRQGQFATIMGDITDRKQAEEQLRQLKEFNEGIVQSTAEGIAVEDAEGYFTFVNPAAATVLGYTPEELVGRHWTDVIPPDQQPTVRAADERRMRGQADRYELELVRKDGTRFPVLVSGSPRFDTEEGRFAGTLAVFTDLSELKRLEEQFLQAQKMEAVGRLAGGVAHDFNNLLTVIHLSSRLLERQLRPEDPLGGHVQRIQDAGRRAANLTKQLLAFSRREIVEPKVLDLNDLIGELSKMLRRLLGEDVELLTALGEDLWPVYADPTQVEQVIVNLAVNARDAMPTGGTLTLETGNVVLDAAYAAHHLEVEPGEYVMLAVSDTGVGMNDEVKAHLFEPFFTTKEKGKGTGLGLSTVFGIVKQNGGHVWVYSEPGQGTSFKIYLPRVGKATQAASDRPTSGATSPLRGSETLLLVEDETEVRELVKNILTAQGYQVLVAQDGVEALQVAGEYKEPIHLLLTDVVMPRMSGRELADQLRARHPQVRVLYMSGYTDNAIVHHGVLEAGIAFLPKPLTEDRLLREVRAVLDATVRPSAGVEKEETP
jgi:PAS domain S-box-containing protein